MNRKFIITLFAMLLLICSALGLAACQIDTGVEKCEHSYSEWTEKIAATCTVEGEKVRTCSKCGTGETKTIDALGHDMKAFSAKAPTCEDAGWDAYEQCSRCEHNTKQVIDALGHDYSEAWTTDENGHWHVCTHEGCQAKSNEGEHGERDHYCSVCNYKMSEHVYGAVSYSWSGDYSVCTATRYCSKCSADAEGQTQIVTATAISSVVKQNADCVKPEIIDFTATFSESWATEQVADEIQTKAALNHDFSESWTTDENGHWHVCTRDNCTAKSGEASHKDENTDHKCDVCEYITSEHTYGDVTYMWNDNNTACTATRTCTNCAAETEGHTQTANATITSQIVQDRTCYQAQLTTYTATFTEDWATTQIKEKVRTLEAAEHSPKENWETNATHHWKNCIYGCTIKQEYAQHSYDSNGVCGECGVEETDVFNAEYDSAADGYKITKYKGAKTVVTVPSSYEGPNGVKPILSVEDKAFQKTSVTKVVFEEGILSIGVYVFEKCASLISVELPSTLKSIGNYAFSYCSSLKSINFPENLTSIGKSVFYQSALTNVVLPDSVTTVGEGAFRDCSRLTSVVLSEKLNNIAQRTFQSCTLLQSVTIPGGVTSIGVYAFMACTSLTSVVIENGVTSVGDLAFADCSGLQSVVIPDSVTSIGTAILRSCNNVEKLSMPSLSKLHDLFDSNGNTISTALTEVSITSGDELFDSMFKGAASLKNVTLAPTIKKIGDSAFSKCTALENIYYTGTTAELVGMSFASTAMAEIFNQRLYVLNGEGSYEKVTEIEIPDTMTELNYYFCKMDSLESITVSSSIKKIKGDAFLKCTGLKNLYYKGTLEDWCGIEFETSWSNPINNTGSLLFWNGNTYEPLTEIAIPETVTKIGNFQFYGLKGVNSVTVPSSVKSIGKLAFYGCSVKTVKITADGTSIGDSVFMRCMSLTTVEIRGKVASMGSSIFYYACVLKTVTLPTGITNFDDDFFTQTSVSTIYFCGTEAEWAAITKESGWDSWLKTLASGRYTLICSDTVTE